MPDMPFVLEEPVRIVIYRYADAPEQWHAACLELALSGWGPTPPVAMENLFKSIAGTFGEAQRLGWDNLFHVFDAEPDPEWDQAYREGRHPADDGVNIDFRGTLTIRITLSDSQPVAEPVGPVRGEPFLPKLQHA